jgi:hypothetical protein
VSFNNEPPEDEPYRNIIRNWMASKAWLEMEYINEVPGESPSLTISARGTLELSRDDIDEALIVNWPSGRFRIRLLGTESYHAGAAGDLRAVIIEFSLFERLTITEAIDIVGDVQ